MYLILDIGTFIMVAIKGQRGDSKFVFSAIYLTKNIYKVVLLHE